MKHIYKMYRFVKLVDAAIRDYEQQHPEILESLTYYHPKIEDIERLYARKYGVSYHEALNTSAASINNHFISGHEFEVNHDIKHGYCMEPEGRRLLESYGLYPYGLVSAILRDLGPTLTLIFGILSSGILYLLWQLVKYILKAI